MALLTLGDLELDGFEIPSSVRFGGAQRAAVHRLLGGGRVIDTMGRDDYALVWSGILSGAAASERARALDALRAQGPVIALAWDCFCYDVIITQLEFDFCSPWWITYKIECTVLADLAQTPVAYLPDPADAIISDLTAASGFIDMSSVLAAASVPGALLPGASGVAAAIANLGAVQATIAPGVENAEAGLDARDIAGLVNASGVLAQLCTAQGFVGRALTTLTGVQA